MNDSTQENTAVGHQAVDEVDVHSALLEGAVSFMRAHTDEWTLVYYTTSPEAYRTARAQCDHAFQMLEAGQINKDACEQLIVQALNDLANPK
ncbi:hypothetical protein [Pseudomonas putida]|uniref:hypothetical protein n=1 Tax=Pseudomonas putida TaxID=303 RepID=UPI000646AD6F|nr:hypothetical protein [Pseudomonas putida]